MHPEGRYSRGNVRVHGDSTMPLTRKLRKAGGSVALTIPRDFAAAMALQVGDLVEIEPIDSRHLRIGEARSSLPS